VALDRGARQEAALSTFLRAKLRMDPIARELVAGADDGDASLVGVPIRAAVKPAAQIDDASARLRMRLGVGPAVSDEGESFPGAQDSGQGDPGPTPDVETGTEAAPAAPGPSVAVEEPGDACEAPSPYGDGSTCGKVALHELGRGAAAKVHRSDVATWEDGQTA
jgi:hypothetical protein